MEYFSEDHHKKLSKEPPVWEEGPTESKNEVQLLQKQLDMDLETLNEHLNAFLTNPEPSQLDQAIIREHIAHLHNLISYDESFHPHIQNQIEQLRLLEQKFDVLT